MLATDITARKHGGNASSRFAYERSSVTAESMRCQILTELKELGPFTMKQFAARHGLTPNQVSGRFSELKLRHKLIEGTGNRIDGSEIVRLKTKDTLF